MPIDYWIDYRRGEPIPEDIEPEDNTEGQQIAGENTTQDTKVD